MNLFKKSRHENYFHVGVFLHGGEPGQVEPRHVASVFVVITFILQVPERCSSESVELQSKLLPFFIGYDINVWNGGDKKNKNMFLISSSLITSPCSLDTALKSGQFIHFNEWSQNDPCNNAIINIKCTQEEFKANLNVINV